jgi:hypothetical protein
MDAPALADPATVKPACAITAQATAGIRFVLSKMTKCCRIRPRPHERVAALLRLRCHGVLAGDAIPSSIEMPPEYPPDNDRRRGIFLGRRG